MMNRIEWEQRASEWLTKLGATNAWIFEFDFDIDIGDNYAPPSFALAKQKWRGHWAFTYFGPSTFSSDVVSFDELEEATHQRDIYDLE